MTWHAVGAATLRLLAPAATARARRLASRAGGYVTRQRLLRQDVLRWVMRSGSVAVAVGGRLVWRAVGVVGWRSGEGVGGDDVGEEGGTSGGGEKVVGGGGGGRWL